MIGLSIRGSALLGNKNNEDRLDGEGPRRDNQPVNRLLSLALGDDDLSFFSFSFSFSFSLSGSSAAWEKESVGVVVVVVVVIGSDAELCTCLCCSCSFSLLDVSTLGLLGSLPMGLGPAPGTTVAEAPGLAVLCLFVLSLR